PAQGRTMLVSHGQTVALLRSRGRSRPHAKGDIVGLTRSALRLAAVAAGIVGGCRVAYDLTVHYGRLLLEVASLREQVAGAERRIAALTRDEAESLPALPPGMVLSDFDLPDLDGNS